MRLALPQVGSIEKLARSVFKLLLELLQLNRAWVFKNTWEMKSLVYGTLVTLLTGNSRMSFSASGLLPLRVSINYDNTSGSPLWAEYDILSIIFFKFISKFKGLCSSLIHTNFSYDSFAIGVIESQGKEQLAKSNFYSIKRENIHVHL